MYILVIIGAIVALLFALLGMGGIVSAVRNIKAAKSGSITELLIAVVVELLGVGFLIFAGVYFDILSLEFCKIFLMVFIPILLPIVIYGCFKAKKILAGIICIFVFAGLIFGAYTFAYNNTKGSDIDAIVAAEHAVSEKLKAPSTAVFSKKSETLITSDGDTWAVKGWVEAENSFGVPIRNEYTVIITFTAKNKYTIDLCQID